MVKQTNNNGLTQEELIREVIGIAATLLIRKRIPVTTRGLLQLLKQEEERAENAGREDIYRAARQQIMQKMQ